MSQITLTPLGQPGLNAEFFSFPGGERHVRLPESLPSGPWTLTALLDDTAGIVDLMLSVDALRRHAGSSAVIHLVMPYVPYARQDRVAVNGEAFSADVFCRLINSLGFDSVTIHDPHSDVVAHRLDRVVIRTAADDIIPTLKDSGWARLIEEAALIAPDAGSAHRVQQVAIAFAQTKTDGLPPLVIQASKTRDPATGRLSAPTVPANLPRDKPLLIVDDICDGGGTFIQLAQVLRRTTSEPLFLYVTHGIFSRGLDPLHEHFDVVFCPHPFPAVAQSFAQKHSKSSL